MITLADALQSAFPDAEVTLPADGISTVRVSLEHLPRAVEQVRGTLGHQRFVDLTAVDRLTPEDRFELVYLFYSIDQRSHLRLKTRTDGAAPSLTPLIPGANWYEREVFDLFGIQFEGHPDLTRIMLPDQWVGHPLRRTEPLGSEPVDFTVTREVYGSA